MKKTNLYLTKNPLQLNQIYNTTATTNEEEKEIILIIKNNFPENLEKWTLNDWEREMINEKLTEQLKHLLMLRGQENYEKITDYESEMVNKYYKGIKLGKKIIIKHIFMHVPEKLLETVIFVNVKEKDEKFIIDIARIIQEYGYEITNLLKEQGNISLIKYMTKNNGATWDAEKKKLAYKLRDKLFKKKWLTRHANRGLKWNLIEEETEKKEFQVSYNIEKNLIKLSEKLIFKEYGENEIIIIAYLKKNIANELQKQQTITKKENEKKQ